MAAKQTPKKQPAAKPAAKAAVEKPDNFAHLQKVGVTVTMRLGSTVMTLDDLTDLGEQSMIEMDKNVDEPIDILVNGRLFARGEVITVSENFGVRLTEIIRQVEE